MTSKEKKWVSQMVSKLRRAGDRLMSKIFLPNIVITASFITLLLFLSKKVNNHVTGSILLIRQRHMINNKKTGRADEPNAASRNVE